MQALTFAGVNLSPWSPEFNSEVAGRWIAHEIPGLSGALQEDMGDGKLGTRVPLTFAGASAQRDYSKLLSALAAAGRRGQLLHPLRGARSSVLRSVKESMKYTSQGNAIVVELAFEDAALALPFDFKGGPQAQAGKARALATATDVKAVALRDKLFRVYALNLSLRSRATAALAQVEDFTAQVRDYITVGLSVGTTAIYLANAAINTGSALALQGVGVVRQTGNATAGAVASYQEARAKLRSLPGTYERAAASVRAVGVSGGQETINGMEQTLYAATLLDQALQDQQPLPVESVVTRAPGQTLYGFISEKYEGSALTPAQKRALAVAILQLNRIRNPSFIPAGTVIVRPAA